jgi:hypothetical protein
MKPLTDIEKYWHGKPFKKWVVYVTKIKGFGTPIKTDKLYVRASSYEKACATGKANSMFTGRISTTARLAGPADLGCLSYMPLPTKRAEVAA